MKPILHVSDIHAHLAWLEWIVKVSSGYGLICVSGNTLNLGAIDTDPEEQIAKVVPYLKRIEAPLVLVSGNHDELPLAGFESATWLRRFLEQNGEVAHEADNLDQALADAINDEGQQVGSREPVAPGRRFDGQALEPTGIGYVPKFQGNERHIAQRGKKGAHGLAFAHAGLAPEHDAARLAGQKGAGLQQVAVGVFADESILWIGKVAADVVPEATHLNGGVRRHPIAIPRNTSWPGATGAREGGGFCWEDIVRPVVP